MEWIEPTLWAIVLVLCLLPELVRYVLRPLADCILRWHGYPTTRELDE